ncbi:uncharacterized protein LOC110826255 isoform X2 [Carica papaya]|nr:uncharacterized protein LOC110826255 isoform X2 [Carica papaya]XP_021912562.1 uncharacterized protein LOC110826255 isoform X2 [Carica papaya]
MEANEEVRKHKEEVKHLLNLLKLAYQERDEAKDQLQKLINKLIPSSAQTELNPILPQVPPESPLLFPTAKANSSITESNSLSHGSSPVDSFFDAVSSPDFSNINVADSAQLGFVKQPFMQDYNCSIPKPLVPQVMTKIDPEIAAIDKLVKGKTLPQKGKLLQAVMEAGPLLQTLLVAGPLPQWRNPPPLQSFKIPPVSIKNYEANTPVLDTQKPALNSVQKPLNNPSSSYVEISRGSSQMCSASLLNFSNGMVSGLSSGRLLSSGPSFSNQIPTGKRQRFQ